MKIKADDLKIGQYIKLEDGSLKKIKYVGPCYVDMRFYWKIPNPIPEYKYSKTVNGVLVFFDLVNDIKSYFLKNELVEVYEENCIVYQISAYDSDCKRVFKYLADSLEEANKVMRFRLYLIEEGGHVTDYSIDLDWRINPVLICRGG